LKKSLSTLILSLAIVVAALFFLLVWEPSIPQTTTSNEPAFSSSAIDCTQMLAGLGYCATCHTVEENKPYAGAVAFTTSFSTLYSTNITSDPDKGFGHWALTAFKGALREGVFRDDSHLSPAFSYTHFKNLTDEDIQALLT
jgi:hypothetical protein